MLAEKINTLGQIKIPALALSKFPDTATIHRDVFTSDDAGGQIAGNNSQNKEYVEIPILYTPRGTQTFKASVGDQLVSVMEYDVFMPTHTRLQDRINIEPNDRILCQARGTESEKTFRVKAIKNEMGVIFTAVCELENET